MNAEDAPDDHDAPVSGQPDPRTAVEALPRDLHELKRRCRALDAAIAAADPARITASGQLVALAWQHARATRDRAVDNHPHGARAHIALHAAHALVGRMFRRAMDRLDGNTASQGHARSTLRKLAATLDLPLDTARGQRTASCTF